jgi:hypothetical protein
MASNRLTDVPLIGTPVHCIDTPGDLVEEMSRQPRGVGRLIGRGH